MWPKNNTLQPSGIQLMVHTCIMLTSSKI